MSAILCSTRCEATPPTAAMEKQTMKLTPVGVHDGSASIAHMLVEPVPRRGVDGFANGSEDAQGAAVPGCDVLLLVAHGHEGPHGGRAGVEDADAVLGHHLPVAPGVRVGRVALVEERRGAQAERAVHHVRVAGDPANVGATSEHVGVLQVERVVRSDCRVHQEAARGVHQALRLARRARGKQGEQRV